MEISEQSRPKVELSLSDALQALTTEYVNIYRLDLPTQTVCVYRFEGRARGVLDHLERSNDYESSINSYTLLNVLPEDQDMFRRMTRQDKLVYELSTKNVYIVHYRVRRESDVHYYFMKAVRIGPAESFDTVILAFANEDADMQENPGMTRPKGFHFRRKLLMVESNPDTRDALTDIVKERYSVLYASDGQAGLELLRENYRDLSVILLGLKSSRLNGFEFLEEVRQTSLLASVPVIVTTDHHSSEDEENCLSLGAADFICAPFNPGVTLKRISSCIRLNESSSTLRAIETDKLTGLYTRGAFFHHAQSVLQRNPNISYDIVMTDIENFRYINERYGTTTGDEMLRVIGSALTENSPDILFARFEADRFVMLLPHTSCQQRTFREMIRFIEPVLPVSNVAVKFGVCENIDRSIPIAVHCDHAFTALNTIKHQYGKYYAVYDDKVKQDSTRKLIIEENMQQALVQKQFQIYYQPKYDLAAHCTAGAEALIRWIHPELGFMCPADFIPLFENNGFITDVDKYVWNQVCETLAQWKAEGKPVVPISINVSRRDFEQPDLVESILRTVDAYQLDHSLLHIEVTESSYSSNPEVVCRSINALHDAGFVIELDDFGVGYTSLSSLSEMKLDILKVDMSILHKDRPSGGRNVLEMTMQLAKMMHLQTVQEGVETESQLERVRALECNYVQGYYYSKPLPKDQFEAYLANG